MFGRRKPVRDAADDVGEAAREITELVRMLKADGVFLSIVRGDDGRLHVKIEPADPETK